MHTGLSIPPSYFGARLLLLLGFEASSTLTMRLTKCGMSGNTRTRGPGRVLEATKVNSIFGGSGVKSHGPSSVSPRAGFGLDPSSMRLGSCRP